MHKKSIKVNLKAKPYDLSDEDIAWVEHTLAKMDLEDRIHQVFAPLGSIPDPEYLKAWVKKIQIGCCYVSPITSKANSKCPQNFTG